MRCNKCERLINLRFENYYEDLLKSGKVKYYCVGCGDRKVGKRVDEVAKVEGFAYYGHQIGFSKHKAYKVLMGMRSRCYNKNSKSYKDYGRKGIKVCDEWLREAKVFVDWALANGWREGLTIDRIDNKGNYEPNNCRFVSKAEQARNKSTNVLKHDDVKGIRFLLRVGEDIKYIAKAYHIKIAHVHAIRDNKIWIGIE